MTALDEVSAILDHRTTQTQSIDYLVQWTSDQGQTWEPATSLSDCAQLLAAYWRVQVTTKPVPYLEPLAEKPPASAKRAAKQPRLDPTVDRIAVAKRVQANKQLRGSLARTGSSSALAARRNAGPAGLAIRSGGVSGAIVDAPVKPPPMNARRSCPAASPVSEAAGMVAGLDLGRKPALQRARKSTGGRRPPPPQ
ncbi:hypothetical protein IWW55_001893 [Coemansia sp. RSA 2706]|nr:hypothetical protein LPJ63_001569 [Coemansia sp. RSA 2711]KAJ2305504.1 hypothetical protein IWW55_001893 [Coemansia sp. RSA 2706]KAJ2327175.1 hypothetical protein IWW51_001889 [Coemansia sp. RSA 2702]